MKLVQLFSAGVLVIGMQMHAAEEFSIPDAPEPTGIYAQYALLAAKEAAEKQTVVTMEESSEPGAPAASQQSYSHTLSALSTSSETESAGDKESTASESSEEAGVELASSSESSEDQVLSSKPTQATRVHLKPPRTLKTADVFTAFFDDMAQNKIPALKANYSSSTRTEYVNQLQDKKRSLEKYQRGEELEALKGRANQLIGRLNRMDQALHQRLPSISATEDSFSPDDSQEKDEEVTQASTSAPSKNHEAPSFKRAFAWIFGGTVAAAAVATIVYYLWYNKLPVLQHK